MLHKNHKLCKRNSLLICTCAPVAGMDIIPHLENIKIAPIESTSPANSLVTKRLIL